MSSSSGEAFADADGSTDASADASAEGSGETDGLAATPLGERLTESFVAHGAVQCGFCIPGMVVQASRVVAQHPDGADDAQVQRAIEGNLCRCTGYRKIVEAIEDVCKPKP